MKLNLRSILAAILALAAAAPGLFPGLSKRQREVLTVDATIDTMVLDMIDLSGAPEGFKEGVVRE